MAAKPILSQIKERQGQDIGSLSPEIALYDKFIRKAQTQDAGLRRVHETETIQHNLGMQQVIFSFDKIIVGELIVYNQEMALPYETKAGFGFVTKILFHKTVFL